MSRYLSTAAVMTAGKYIIDVDTGVDDAQALMLALSQSNMDILAITCVAGNTDVDQVCINTLKVLKACNRLEVSLNTTCYSHRSTIKLKSDQKQNMHSPHNLMCLYVIFVMN